MCSTFGDVDIVPGVASEAMATDNLGTAELDLPQNTTS